ncbi:hypothetical protein V3851_22375 [Paenibacillus sp. M1]|uniref:ABC transporter permease n=1 Tax=Paenibacillus haidiansis TaxID=1574488 RepID=A0ABU7VXS7_9BACL
MDACLRLLGKDLKLMKGWILGGIAILVAVGLLGGWLAYRNSSGIISIGMTGFLFIQVFYLPVYLWISLSKEWRSTSAMWMQLPKSGWTLLAIKLVSAVIGMCVTYAIAYAMFYGISYIDGDFVWPQPFGTGEPEFNPIPYIGYMRESFFGVFSVVFYLSAIIGIWTLLFSVSVQAVKPKLHRFSWPVMFIVLVLIIWGFLSLSETAGYAAVTKWGALTGDSAWAVMELHSGELVVDVLVCAIFFFLAGWLMERKVEV